MENTPDKNRNIENNVNETEDEIIPRFLRARKIIGRSALALALTATSAGGVLIIENPDLRDIIGGTLDDGSSRVPQIEGCEYVPEPTPTPSTSSTTPDTTPTSTTTTTTPDEKLNIASDSYDLQSAARKGTFLDYLNPKTYFDIKHQYDLMFENKIGEYKDEYTGVEFHFFSRGDHNPPEYDPKAIADIMTLGLNEDNLATLSGETSYVMECIKDKIENEGALEGKKVAIVMASNPYTCAAVHAIVEYSASEQMPSDCISQGLTMPEHDISFFGKHLNNPEYDTFVYLSGQEGSTRRIKRLAVHELSGHLLYVLMGDKFGMDSDESFAKFTQYSIYRNELDETVPTPIWYEGFEPDDNKDEIITLADMFSELAKLGPFSSKVDNDIFSRFKQGN